MDQQRARTTPADTSLIGIGLYTLAEASRLIGVAPGRLARWLRGHAAEGRWHQPLWSPEIDLGDGSTHLSFRDLLEARTASLFIAAGLSPQRVRAAIGLARAVVGDRPLSTTWLRTDGRTVFLRVIDEDGGEPQLLDLFKRQYAFNAVVERSLKGIDFQGSAPRLWWPRGHQGGIVLDPARSFGQPIDAATSVPVEILVAAAHAEGDFNKAARAWDVPIAAVRRAVAFQRGLADKQAA